MNHPLDTRVQQNTKMNTPTFLPILETIYHSPFPEPKHEPPGYSITTHINSTNNHGHFLSCCITL